MRLVVDITHPCDINFFRASIERWRGDGHDVSLVVLDRGRVPAIVDHEYPHLSKVRVGKHAPTKLGLYLQTGLLREFQLTVALAGQRVDAVVGFPGFQTAIVGRVLGAKSVGCYDDPEHRPNMVLAKLFCDELILPEYLEETGRNVRTVAGLKEWAYLSPRYFTPDPAVLEEYGLKAGEYVFIREIEPRSLNYMDVKGAIISEAYAAGLDQERVVLSLENKSRRSLFPNWTILEEPVSDIFSLMYFSRLVVSSGDSMAREGAQLGVPSVYAGSRIMKANEALYRMGIMHQRTDAEGIVAFAREVAAVTQPEQQRVRERLLDEWQDVADVVTESVYRLTNYAAG